MFTPQNTVIRLSRGVLRNPGTALYAAGVAASHPAETLEAAGFSRAAKVASVAGPYGLAAAALYGIKKSAEAVAYIDDNRPTFSSSFTVKRLRQQPQVKTAGQIPGLLQDATAVGQPADTQVAAVELTPARNRLKTVAALEGSRKRAKGTPSGYSPYENPLTQVSPNPRATPRGPAANQYRNARWKYLPYSRTVPRQAWLHVTSGRTARRKRRQWRF